MTTREELAAAVDLALAGSWDEAHEIAQRHEGDAAADWLHAVLHKIEGDGGNARYWYRRCGKVDRARDDATVELAAIRQALDGAR
ncbi:MAG: hypothetical protein K8S94_06745 [Planctomycetia bacterium]|nr:hypothetical protein [Planctomycetia bacterium]